MSRRRPAALALVLAAAALAGCGAEEDPGPDYSLVTPPAYVGAPPLSTPTPGRERRMTAADARRLRPVLAGWADAVRRGDPARATGYFALPAIVFQPSFGAVALASRPVAEAFNGALPCGAQLVGARAAGRYIVGTFELRERPGSSCTTPGDRVRVGFVFGDRDRPRRFTEWWQVAEGQRSPGPDERPAAPVADATTFG